MKIVKSFWFVLLLSVFSISQSYAYTTVSGNMTSNQTWTSGNTYYVSSNLVVVDGITLTIEDDVVVKFHNGQGITVLGTLHCNGSLGNEIYFTSKNDNTVGQTISGSNGNPNAGDWRSVFVWDVDASANMSYVTMRYGGFGSSSTPVLKFEDAQASAIDHIFVRYGYNYGLSVENTEVDVDYLDINDQYKGIYLEGGSTESFSNIWIDPVQAEVLTLRSTKLTDLSAWNITADENQYIEIYDSLADTSVIKNTSDVVYVLQNEVNANRLHIYDGVLIKANTSAALVVTNGLFRTLGNDSFPVIFTSLKDDIGGDTNGDGTASSPAAGDWKGIIIDGVSSTSYAKATIKETWVRYGGANWNSYSANLFLREASGGSTVRDSRFELSSGAGARTASCSPVFTRNSFYNNGEDVIVTGSTDVPNFGSVSGNNLFRNPVLAIDNFGTHTIYAKGNDFGTNDSTTISQRVGNAVSSTGEVFFDPWFEKEDAYWQSLDKNTIENAGVYNQLIMTKEETPAGTIILYQTTEGRYGKFKILDRIGNSIRIWWETFNDDGSTYSAGTDFYISSTGDASIVDLDKGITDYFVDAPTDKEFYMDEGDFISASSSWKSLVYCSYCSYATHSGGTSGNVTWEAGTHYVSGDYTIYSGDTLTIDPGATVKFAGGGRLTVYGTVLAQGVSTVLPIWFTSANDDMHGCIIDGSTGNPQAGDWQYISMHGYYEKTGKFRYCHFAYGGNGSNGILTYSNGGSGYVKQCTVEQSSHSGLHSYQSDIEVDSSIFKNNAYHGIEYGYYSTVRVSNSSFLDNGNNAISAGSSNFWDYCNNNTATGNQLNGIVIISLGNNAGQRLVNHNSMPFIIYGTLWVGSGNTLRIGGGGSSSLVKMNNNASIYVNGGQLIAFGTTFTSIKDDSEGGDTNNDGSATSPAPGDWKNIHILYSKNSDISQCHLKYGGSSSAEVYFSNNGGGNLNNSFIEYSKYYGVQAHSAPLDIWACHINNNGKSGIYLYGSDSTTIRNSDFNNNTEHGINISYNSSAVEISNNEMNNNGMYPVYCDGSSQLKTAITHNEMDGNLWDAVVVASLDWSKRQDFYPVTGLSSSINYAYVFLNSIQTYSTDTAEFHSNTVIKFPTDKYFDSRGKILAHSTCFTSLHDDSVGGDTENDGAASTPAKGDWRYIGVDQGGYALFDSCSINYGGSNNNAQVRFYVNAQGIIQNSFVKHSAQDGILKSYSGNVKILNNTIYDNDRNGVYVYGQQDTLQINGNTFELNGSDAIALHSTVSTDIYDNTFTDNGGYPVSFTGNCVINDQFTGNTSSGNLMEGFAINAFEDNAHNILYYQANLPYIFTNSMISYSTTDTMEVQGSTIVKFLPNVQVEFRGNFITHGGLFTSIKDDSMGGDTNNDADATSPAPGDWRGIEVYNGKGDMHGGVIRYGGASNTPALYFNNSGGYISVLVDSSAYDGLRVNSANNILIENSYFSGNARYGLDVHSIDTLVIDNCDFLGNLSHGITVYSSAPNIDNCNFENNVGYPVYFTGGSIINKEFSGNTCSNNLLDGFAVNTFNSYAKNIFYYQEDIPFIFPNSIIAYSTADTVQIEDAVFKFLPNTYLELRSHLIANGGIFTSIKDDTYGGDSNHDGAATSPATGDWRYLEVYNNNAQFLFSRIRYGGANSSNSLYISNSNGLFSGWVEHSAYNGIGVTNANNFELSVARLLDNSNYGLYANNIDTLTISGSIINNNASHGIAVSSSAPDIDNCSFNNNGGYPVYFTSGSIINKEFSNNSCSNNLLDGFAVNTFNSYAKNIFYYQEDIPFIIPNSIIAYSTADTVQIEGAVFKFLPNTYLELRSHLIANGGVFTSIKDDTFGGDSNHDGVATSPSPGDWRYLQVYNNTLDFHDTKFRYGGASNSGSLYISGNASGYIDADAEYSAYDGVRLSSFGNLEIENSHFNNNSYRGIYASGGTTLSIQNSVISANGNVGIYNYANDNSSLRGNTITGNGSYGIYVYNGSGEIFNMGNNDPNDKGENIIKNNDGGNYQLYNNSSNEINAYYNDWGYNTAAEIDAHIYDDDENSSKGVVHFNPWYVYNVAVDLTAILEGAFNGTDMNVDLNSLNLIPLAQPYNVAPWNYSGTESVAAMPNANVVDWVLVELRDAPNAASANEGTIIDRQAGFLLKDGSIVNVDGVSTLSFAANVSENLFVVIQHRNHLEMMSANALTQAAGVYAYDFTSAVNKAYGNSQKLLSGKAVMYGGDANGDGSINIGDATLWNAETGTAGYLKTDVTLDGQADNKDKNDVWVPNNGLDSQVPE